MTTISYREIDIDLLTFLSTNLNLNNDVIDLLELLVKYFYDYYDIDYRYCLSKYDNTLFDRYFYDVNIDEIQYEELYIEYKNRYIKDEIKKFIESRLILDIIKDEIYLDILKISLINICENKDIIAKKDFKETFYDKDNNKYYINLLKMLIEYDNIDLIYYYINNINIFNDIYNFIELDNDNINDLLSIIIKSNKLQYINILNNKTNNNFNINEDEKMIILKYYKKILPKQIPYLLVNRYIKNDIQNNNISYLFNDNVDFKYYKSIINAIFYYNNYKMIKYVINKYNNKDIKRYICDLNYMIDNDKTINILLNNKDYYNMIYDEMINFYINKEYNNDNFNKNSIYNQNMYKIFKIIINKIITNIDFNNIEIIDNDIIFSYANHFLNYLNNNDIIEDEKLLLLILEDLFNVVTEVIIFYIFINYKKYNLTDEYIKQIYNYIEFLYANDNVIKSIRYFVYDNKDKINLDDYPYINNNFNYIFY